MKKSSFILFGKPFFSSEEDKKVKNVLKSNWIGTGPVVQKFEKVFFGNPTIQRT